MLLQLLGAPFESKAWQSHFQCPMYVNFRYSHSAITNVATFANLKSMLLYSDNLLMYVYCIELIIWSIMNGPGMLNRMVRGGGGRRLVSADGESVLLHCDRSRVI